MDSAAELSLEWGMRIRTEKANEIIYHPFSLVFKFSSSGLSFWWLCLKITWLNLQGCFYIHSELHHWVEQIHDTVQNIACKDVTITWNRMQSTLVLYLSWSVGELDDWFTSFTFYYEQVSIAGQPGGVEAARVKIRVSWNSATFVFEGYSTHNFEYQRHIPCRLLNLHF